uniref:Uncharacterized protein n=1 Tax=Anopheles atroparvus TaxID=41427 RepID=A0AAG5CWV0_ANOAO
MSFIGRSYTARRFAHFRTGLHNFRIRCVLVNKFNWGVLNRFPGKLHDMHAMFLRRPHHRYTTNAHLWQNAT